MKVTVSLKVWCAHSVIHKLAKPGFEKSLFLHIPIVVILSETGDFICSKLTFFNEFLTLNEFKTIPIEHQVFSFV